MAQLDPKQLAQSMALPGQTMTWNGIQWTPDSVMRAALQYQESIILLLIQTLKNEKIRLPPELEDFEPIF